MFLRWSFLRTVHFLDVLMGHRRGGGVCPCAVDQLKQREFFFLLVCFIGRKKLQLNHKLKNVADIGVCRLLGLKTTSAETPPTLAKAALFWAKNKFPKTESWRKCVCERRSCSSTDLEAVSECERCVSASVMWVLQLIVGSVCERVRIGDGTK